VNPALQFNYLYHDVDVIELRVTVENACFRGSADVYVGTDELAKTAAILKGFPEHSRDAREYTFGAFGPKYAGGAVRLEFYCKDMACHFAVWATIDADYQSLLTSIS
jgi:hypothetical protein